MKQIVPLTSLTSVILPARFSAGSGGAFMSRKHYELRFLPLFEHDLNEIVDYITYRSLQNKRARN